MKSADLNLLFEEILTARERVYSVGKVTPLQKLPLPALNSEVWVKREDLSPIKAYKWRGAYNAMAALSEKERQWGVVAASAGNHAQGVALAAQKLSCKAVIYMPRSTPEVKQSEVLRLGGDAVEIRLVGDTYDDAGIAAREFCDSSKGVYIHPYDDVVVMGGQGTLADEVVMSGEGPFDRVYVPIGGGGLAASVACWLKRYWPDVKVYGVEGVDQASMSAAFEAGEPTQLDYVDVFCDKGFFTVAETDILLKAGAKYGLKPKIHANELDYSGGIQVGVKYNALSVDHLEYTGDEEIKVLLNSDTMPTMLPGAAFFLGMIYGPARKMIDAGLPLALASDFNPGSSPSGNMQLITAMGCIKYKMLPEEVIYATTINTAYAMGLSDELGSIAVGKRANFWLSKPMPTYQYLPYSYGDNKVDTVFLNGKKINK